ncbi:hypothetical protein ElyMa_003944900 [Elysia marginata]|uniref:Uncharacterized protein n=1 Tax=Elysia marginata TaxID=1093978 RepID=A0AAV4FW09_9GAST|nr:hypothetical protein ElyMa_003944900 [Elysia marginata]
MGREDKKLEAGGIRIIEGKQGLREIESEGKGKGKGLCQRTNYELGCAEERGKKSGSEAERTKINHFSCPSLIVSSPLLDIHMFTALMNSAVISRSAWGKDFHREVPP